MARTCEPPHPPPEAGPGARPLRPRRPRVAEVPLDVGVVVKAEAGTGAWGKQISKLLN